MDEMCVVSIQFYFILNKFFFNNWYTKQIIQMQVIPHNKDNKDRRGPFY